LPAVRGADELTSVGSVSGRRTRSVPASRSGPGKPARAGRRRRELAPYVLLTPSLVILAVMLAYPLFLLVRTSFQKLDLPEFFRRETVYNGFHNYATLLKDDLLLPVFWRTVLFAGLAVAFTLVLSMLIALLMQTLHAPFRWALQIVLLLVWAVPAVTATVIWRTLFDSEWGVVNYLLSKITGHDWTNHGWFLSGPSAFSVILALVVYQAIPFAALALYAGLVQVPGELVEAARVDGASPWKVFWNIKMPMIKPVLLIVTVLSIIWDFRVFVQIWAITQGGPDNKTLLFGVWSYRTAFAESHFGLASAIAVFTVVMLLAISGFYVREMLKSEEL
jgi:N,N'-diacetylchitobiose transport system permease protein